MQAQITQYILSIYCLDYHYTVELLQERLDPSEDGPGQRNLITFEDSFIVLRLRPEPALHASPAAIGSWWSH